MTKPLHVGVIVERRYLSQAQPRGLLDALERRGIGVSLFEAEATSRVMGDDSWLNGLDLLVGRGRSVAVMSLLGWAEAAGIPAINRRTAIAAVFNKADMSVLLAANHVPMPTTYFGSMSVLSESIPADAYPVILKPVFGDNCRGLVIVDDRAALAAVEWSESVALAQPFFKTDGFDLKLYGIGRDVWAVRKPSPLELPGREKASGSSLVEMTPELEELGRKSGALFGLELFGADCIMTPDGPLVIEVNDYPNFTAVPDADERLADYVIRRASGEAAA